VPEDMPLLLEHALPAEVLALAVNRGLPNKLLSNARKILATLLESEEEADAVELVHDAEWKEFPELGEAIKAAGGEEVSICLAICPGRNSWAVGVAGKTKVREPAARLALCAALAPEAPTEVFAELAAQWPEFAELCENAGAVPVDYVPEPPPAKRHRGDGGATNGAAFEPAAQQQRPQAEAPPMRALPRDMPLWLTLAEDAERPEALDGMGDEALVVSTDGTKRKGLYSRADEALKHILAAMGVAEADIGASVEYHDDANWERFPAVGEALKRMAPAEECICVSVCPAFNVWAVGVGMKGKARFNAAKAAMAGALAVVFEEAGDGAIDFGEDLPSVAEFIGEVLQSRGGAMVEQGAEEDVEEADM